MDLSPENEPVRGCAGLESERVGVVVGEAGVALRPHGGEEEQRVAVEGSGGEAPEEDVEEDGGAVGGGVEHRAGGRERGARGVGLDELDADGGGGRVGGRRRRKRSARARRAGSGGGRARGTSPRGGGGRGRPEAAPGRGSAAGSSETHPSGAARRGGLMCAWCAPERPSLSRNRARI